MGPFLGASPSEAAESRRGYAVGYDGIASDPTVWGNFRFPNELTQSKNRFSFTGYLWDKETSLFFAKARFYDPEIGRFISQDSFLGDISKPPTLHRYFYASDNPTTRIDLTGLSDADANALAKALGRTGIYGLNRAANQVAAPITQRLEGATSLVVPVSYLRDSKGEGASYTRRAQYWLIDLATDKSNSALARTAAGLGAAVLQPGAALNDIAHGLAGVPSQLGEAGSHIKRAFQAESGRAAALELTEAVEKTASAAETTIGAIILTRGGAKVVEEGRAGRAKMVPAEGKVEPRAPAAANYESYGGEFIGEGLRMADQPLSLSRVRAGRLSRIKAEAKAFEERVLRDTRATQEGVADQVSIRPNTATGPADFWVRPESIGKEPGTGVVRLRDAKSSETAPLTPGQAEGYPLIEQHGGTVIGKKGGTLYPAGTQIPPTKVKIVRPKDLNE